MGLWVLTRLVKFHFEEKVNARLENVKVEHLGCILGQLGHKFTNQEALHQQAGEPRPPDNQYAQCLKIVYVKDHIFRQLVLALPVFVNLERHHDLEGLMDQSQFLTWGLQAGNLGQFLYSFWVFNLKGWLYIKLVKGRLRFFKNRR